MKKVEAINLKSSNCNPTSYNTDYIWTIDTNYSGTITYSQSTDTSTSTRYISITEHDLNAFRLGEDVMNLFLLGRIDEKELSSLWKMTKSVDEEVIGLVKILISELQTGELKNLRAKRTGDGNNQ